MLTSVLTIIFELFFFSPESSKNQIQLYNFPLLTLFIPGAHPLLSELTSASLCFHHVNNNLLPTERKSWTGKYWSEAVPLQLKQARLARSLLYGNWKEKNTRLMSNSMKTVHAAKSLQGRNWSEHPDSLQDYLAIIIICNNVFYYSLSLLCPIHMRWGGLMVSALISGSSSPGSSPGWGHCIVFLSKTLLSQCLSPPRCINGYWQF